MRHFSKMFIGRKVADHNMNKLLEQYLNPAFVYRFTHNPNVVHSRQDAIRHGINCISLAHLALKDLFNHQLLPELGCAELYNDKEDFHPVEDFESMQVGDLVWFGQTNPKIEPEEFVPYYQGGQLLNWADFPVKHVAIYTGVHNEDYLLLHSTHLEGTNVIWPLAKFSSYERYKRIYGISRLKAANIKQAGSGTI